jgi:hypothetical protein
MNEFLWPGPAHGERLESAVRERQAVHYGDRAHIAARAHSGFSSPAEAKSLFATVKARPRGTRQESMQVMPRSGEA